MTETLIVQKVAYILASFCEREWFSYLFSVLRKISYKLEKMEKNSEKFFITLFHYPISVMRYTSPIKREPRNFFLKNEVFLTKKNEGVILDDGNIVGPKSSLYLCCSSQKRTVSVSFISFEKYELRMRKKFSKNFSSSFLPKNTKYEKTF